MLAEADVQTATEDPWYMPHLVDGQMDPFLKSILDYEAPLSDDKDAFGSVAQLNDTDGAEELQGVFTHKIKTPLSYLGAQVGLRHI